MLFLNIYMYVQMTPYNFYILHIIEVFLCQEYFQGGVTLKRKVCFKAFGFSLS